MRGVKLKIAPGFDCGIIASNHSAPARWNCLLNETCHLRQRKSHNTSNEKRTNFLQVVGIKTYIYIYTVTDIYSRSL